MARKFIVPFGVEGERVEVPNPLQADGSVSMTRGYGTDYELEDTDPNYKPFPRKPYNGLMFDITDAIFEMQLNGLATWDVLAGPYPINALVRHSNANWRNTIANNNSEPGAVDNTTWVDSNVSTQLLDSVRVNINAAANIDLNAQAPQTRHINIVGVANIANFTIAAGNCYFVKFSGASLIISSAAIITQSGQNIQVAAGDSCIIRAIEGNVVEVLCYTPGIRQEIGYGQSWRDVTSQRTVGTSYINTTGRPISVIINTPTNQAITANVSGFSVYGSYTPASGQPRGSLSFIVPAGASYALTGSGAGYIWLELR